MSEYSYCYERKSSHVANNNKSTSCGILSPLRISTGQGSIADGGTTVPEHYESVGQVYEHTMECYGYERMGSVYDQSSIQHDYERLGSIYEHQHSTYDTMGSVYEQISLTRNLSNE